MLGFILGQDCNVVLYSHCFTFTGRILGGGGFTKGAPKRERERREKRKKKRKEKEERKEGDKKGKIGKSTCRGRHSRVGCSPSLFFVEIGHQSLCGRLRQKECTKSRELASKIDFFFSPSDTPCNHLTGAEVLLVLNLGAPSYKTKPGSAPAIQA